jgi:hypothetical protein
MTKELVAAAVAAAGFAAGYTDAFDDGSYDEAIRESHFAGTELVGYDVGTPIIRADGQAFFGPIVTPAPKGEEAGRLWDAHSVIQSIQSIPGVYEIKRTRETQPDFD